MVTCLVLSAIDLEAYNFGLYIVLLCIVGTMLACALCIANPNACQNPEWYNNMCFAIQEMHPIQENSKLTAGLDINALRARTALLVNANLRQDSRSTVAMLGPAVHIMHQVWKGMAWVAEGIDEEDETGIKSPEHTDQQEPSQSPTTDSNLKKLSTIVESSIISDGASQVFREIKDDSSSTGRFMF